MEQVTWFQGVERESTAYKLLAKMGWQEGQGLVSLYQQEYLAKEHTLGLVGGS